MHGNDSILILLTDGYTASFRDTPATSCFWFLCSTAYDAIICIYEKDEESGRTLEVS